jgi:hypothetical protein
MAISIANTEGNGINVIEQAEKGLFEPVKMCENRETLWPVTSGQIGKHSHSAGVFLAVQSYFRQHRTKKAGKGVIAR